MRTPVVLFGPFSLLLACTAAANHPNIILMMADDMGMGDTSAYQDFTGNSDADQIATPNMEKLANMGVRFLDAHTPASRCSPTRYGLLTGRYPWRNRLKHWVLFGSQGDPMIEADRPTIASMLRDEGYATAMFGKWHVGLRYRRADGSPAAGFLDADLTQPLHTSPVDHGFDVARFTSRSHGTSGPEGPSRKNTPDQNVGPGHIDDRIAIGATGNGRELAKDGPTAYILNQLGSRHSDHALEFLNAHVAGAETKSRPFFLYYPSNSNHGPYTPDEAIGGKPVAGAARSKSGSPMDVRYDYIYENDVALGRLLDWLETTDDPRQPESKLIENTLVIFTSDNGAEKNSNIASGPFRSHKGSCYEGGHRVPFLVTWKAGSVGDGDPSTPGTSSPALIGLQDLYATFAEIVGSTLPDLRTGGKGAEDSISVLKAFRGEPMPDRPPLLFNDHKEAKKDPAVLAMRLDDPEVNGQVVPGSWKIFFQAKLTREGIAEPFELYNLAKDQMETTNLISNPEYQPLVDHLAEEALLARTSGGHRLADFAPSERIVFNWTNNSELAQQMNGKPARSIQAESPDAPLKLTIQAEAPDGAAFSLNPRGLGLSTGKFEQVDSGEALLLSFDQDVLVESVALVAGNGTCGGFYRVGDTAPLAIYCVDADIDAKDQQGLLSDIGVLKAGETLRLDCNPHLENEAPGQWRLAGITVRPF